MAHEDTGQHITGGLPEHFPSANETGNYKLLKPIADELDKHEDDIDEADLALSVQDADSIAKLKKLGELVDTPPNEGETISHYRARLIAEYSINTCEGTIEDVLQTTAEIFDADVGSITFIEPAGGEYGTIELGLPARALDSTALTDAEVAEILERLVAASYRVTGYQIGTFTYITPTDYDNNNHDASLGYDGLDANGDPKDNGGTYAGLLQ
jgi:hypothetical protein